MAASTIVMLVSPKIKTKGGGQVTMFCFFLFMPSPSRNGRNREGQPCMEKGIIMTVSTI